MKRFLGVIVVLALMVSIVGMIVSNSAVAADSTIQTELFYDDGELNFGWSTGPLGGGAVLFNPPITPWILSKIKVMAWYWLDDAPFFIEIWDSDRQELYTVTYMYSDYFTSHPGGWVEIEIPNIVVEGNFYVGVFGNWAETHFLALGGDNNSPISYRSFAVRYDNNSIDYVEEWNWMIRAIGAPPPPPPVEVGGTVYPLNKLSVLILWILLVAAIIPVATIVIRRRRAQG